MTEETVYTFNEDTTPNEEYTQESTFEEDSQSESIGFEEESANQVDLQDGDASTKRDEQFLDVKFNKAYKTLSKDEAVKYAQMGMNYERFLPMISKLDYLAAVCGVTREEFIDKQLKFSEDAMRQDIINRFGDDEKTVSEMLEFKKQQNKAAYDNMLMRTKLEEEKSEEKIQTRLASEFAEMCVDFPELCEKGFKGLPNEVKKAGFDGQNLMSAYLLYKHREGKKAAAALDLAEKAAQKATGSLKSQSASNFVGDAFLMGLLKK